MSAEVWRPLWTSLSGTTGPGGLLIPVGGPGGVGRLMSFLSLGSRSAPRENGNGDLFLIPRFPLSRCLFSHPLAEAGRSQRLGPPPPTLSCPPPCTPHQPHVGSHWDLE